MEKVLGIHRDKLLPDFAAQTFERWAEQSGKMARDAGRRGGAVPDLLRAEQRAADRPRHASRCWRRTGSTCGCVEGPAVLRHAGLGARATSTRCASRRRRNLDVLHAVRGGGRQGAGHQPDLLHDDAPRVPRAASPPRTASARSGSPQRCMDPGEFLWSIRNEPRFNTDVQEHARAAGRLPRALPPARAGGRLQGPRPAAQDPRRRAGASCMECCGHDGTYAMKVEGFEASQRASARRPSTA